MNRWTYSTNAKDIGVLYIIFSMISGIIGTTLSIIIRGELAGYVKTENEIYNVIVTMHGIIMIFFMIMPGLIGGFGKREEIKESRTEKGEEREEWGSYIAGLIEGGGTLSITKEKRIRIYIVLNIKERPLAEYLKGEIGVGEVKIYKERGCIIWEIEEREEVKRIIELINGKMRTPKGEELERIIKSINEREVEGKEIKSKGIDRSDIGTNAWLAGYTEVEGDFKVNIIRSKRGKEIRIQLIYKLEIRQTDNIRGYNLEGEEGKEETYYKILSKISEYLETNLYSKIKKEKDKKRYRYIIITQNKKGIKKIKEYIEKYKLLSSKKKRYKDWIKVYEIRERGEHKTKEGEEECERIKIRMKKG